jgi:uncharacterized membrane protein YcgQ (UPF0703/DUF1980 family)
MDKPVYLFAGFLDAGKTTAVQDSLYDRSFNAGEKSLILAFERGDVEYDREFLLDTNSEVVYYDSLSQLTKEEMKKVDAMYQADRIVMELNGMDDETPLFSPNGMIPNWILAQSLTFFNGQTLRVQMLNWKQFVYNHVRNAEQVIINRVNQEDILYFRNNLKAINPMTQVVFMDDDYNVIQNISQQLFDLSKPLDISDDDYGLWYMDALDDPQKYDGKRITLKMKLEDVVKEYVNVVVMGRRAMVCCSNDIQTIGITCVNVDPKTIVPEQYYAVSGQLKCLDDIDGNKTCVLYADAVRPSEAPAVDLVSFS